MKEKNITVKNLEKKYHKTEEVTNFKDMLYRSASIYSSRIAFKLKDENHQIVHITYKQFKEDVEFLGTSLIQKGLLNKRICVIGKNSYECATSYLAASIVGITISIKAGVVEFYKDGKLIETATLNNGKLAYTGNSTNVVLVVSSIAIVALATGIVAKKKLANA